MMKRLALAIALSACAVLTAAAEANSLPLAPHMERPVALLTVMKRGVTTKQAYVFPEPGRGKILKSVPPGAVLFVTGDEYGRWSEVWVEDVGTCWIPTSVIRVVEPEK